MIRQFKSSRGIMRDQMPQIHKSKSVSFCCWLQSEFNVKSTFMNCRVFKIKPTQSEYNQDKVLSKIDEGLENIKKPFIISMDGYLLDGHHSYKAIFNINQNEVVDVIRVQATIDSLINYAKKYEHSYTKDINDVQIDV